jgi:hypothetical protein
MANEISITMVMSVTKGLLANTQNPGTQLFDMSGTRAAGGAQAASNSATAVAIDLGTLASTDCGWMYLRNTSVTGSEVILVGTGTSSFTPFIELRPKEVALFRLNGTAGALAPTFRSVTGSPVLQYWIAEK